MQLFLSVSALLNNSLIGDAATIAGSFAGGLTTHHKRLVSLAVGGIREHPGSKQKLEGITSGPCWRIMKRSWEDMDILYYQGHVHDSGRGYASLREESWPIGR